METKPIMDKNGHTIYISTPDVSKCPMCGLKENEEKKISIGVAVMYLEEVYNGDGLHWASCGCQWYVEGGTSKILNQS